MTTTTPTLPYAMSSNDSKDEQTNTKNKWGGGGYSSEDIHQKHSKDSQGKQASSRRDYGIRNLFLKVQINPMLEQIFFFFTRKISDFFKN